MRAGRFPGRAPPLAGTTHSGPIRDLPVEALVRASLLKFCAWTAVVLLAALGGSLLQFHRILDQPLAFGSETRHHLIAPGTSFSGIVAGLKEAGLVSHRHVLELHGRWSGLAGGIRAGEYAIDPAMTPRELLELLHSGKVVQHSLTLVEGWTFDEVRDALRSRPELEHTLAAELGPGDVMAALGYAGEHPEGRFLADTYHFPRGTSDAAFLRRAYRAMQDFLDRAWKDRAANLPYDSPYDALIVASIVEKETGRAEERAEIAGVLVRRLKRGMRLEVDPTVIYGLGDAFDGNLRKRDLRRDTPYNTYLHRGLPPTPIAMPGAAAIRAALHPRAGEALFFVAKGDGSHYFSATYREHQKAVARYQRSRRARDGSDGS